MKNILFVHASADLYGSDRSLYNLIKNLDKTQYRPFILLPYKGPLMDLLCRVENTGVFVHDFAVLRRKNFSMTGMIQYFVSLLGSVIRICRLIRSNNITVVYTNTSVVFPGAIAAKLCGIKSIWHIREILQEKPMVNKVLRTIIDKFSDVIIVNSQATKESVMGKNPQKIKVIYNAIDVSSNIAADSKNEFKERYKIKDEELIVGMAGRINRWKGQKLFIDMAAEVVRYKKNVKFVIAGDTFSGEESLLENLKEYVAAKQIEASVIFTGNIKNMNEFYSALDIFVLPSIKPEPFGLVVLEAMSKGIPVVATNHGGPVEIIDDGEDGFLVDHRDCLQMSKIILTLLDDKNLRDRIGEKAKEKPIRNFSMQKYVSQIEDTLFRLNA